MTCKTIKNNVRNFVIVGNDGQLRSWYWVMTEWWWWWRVSAQLKLSLRLTDGGDGQQHSLTLSDPGPDCWTEDKLIFTSLAGLWPWARRMAETDYYICVMWTQKCRNTNTSGYTQYKTGRIIHWVLPLVCTAISLAGDGIQGSEYQSGFVNNNDYHWAAQLSHYYHPAPRQYNHAQIFSPWDRNDSMVTGLYTKLEEQWWERCGERGSRVNKQAPRSPFIVVNWYPPDSVYF